MLNEVKAIQSGYEHESRNASVCSANLMRKDTQTERTHLLT